MKSIRLALIAIAAVASAAAATISLAPASPSIQAGQTINLNINIAGASDLSAWQFDIGFDPTVLQAVSTTEGTFLSSIGPTFFDPGTIDNIGGTVTFVLDTLFSSGASGSGTLASITFQGAGVGTSPVNILNVTLLDSTLTEISPTSITISSGSVQVTPSTAPEPGSLVLIASALSAAFIAKRRMSSRKGGLVPAILDRKI